MGNFPLKGAKMSEIRIHNGDVLTFTALKWEEEGIWKPETPAMLLSPVTHFYEDGIDLDTIIDEALLDIKIDGKLRDMRFRKFLSKRGWNRKYLKHIFRIIRKGKEFSGKNYSILKETYKFWRDENGRFQYMKLNSSH